MADESRAVVPAAYLDAANRPLDSLLGIPPTPDRASPDEVRAANAALSLSRDIAVAAEKDVARQTQACRELLRILATSRSAVVANQALQGLEFDPRGAVLAVFTNDSHDDPAFMAGIAYLAATDILDVAEKRSRTHPRDTEIADLVAVAAGDRRGGLQLRLLPFSARLRDPIRSGVMLRQRLTVNTRRWYRQLQEINDGMVNNRAQTLLEDAGKFANDNLRAHLSPHKGETHIQAVARLINDADLTAPFLLALSAAAMRQGKSPRGNGPVSDRLSSVGYSLNALDPTEAGRIAITHGALIGTIEAHVGRNPPGGQADASGTPPLQ